MTGKLTLQSSISRFANAIFENVTTLNPGQSLIISPISIQTCLALTSIGASASTLQAMDSGLDLGMMSTMAIGTEFQNLLAPFQNNSVIDMANAVYLKNTYTISPSFEEVAVNQFYSSVQTIDFPANGVNVINNWVSNHTHGMIQNLVAPNSFTPYTLMVLVNAVYFNGGWIHKFPLSQTASAPFYKGSCTNANVEQIQMMNQMVGCRRGRIGVDVFI